MMSTSSFGLGVGQAAADFVEQQRLRIGGERARQFEPLAVDEAERLGPPVGDRRSCPESASDAIALS